VKKKIQKNETIVETSFYLQVQLMTFNQRDSKGRTVNVFEL